MCVSSEKDYTLYAGPLMQHLQVGPWVHGQCALCNLICYRYC